MEDKNVKKLGCGILGENEKEPVVKISCGLEVEVNPKDKVINLAPGILQFFTFEIIKSCGKVVLKSNNRCDNKVIIGNLAEYKIFANGILVNAYNNLNSLRNDILIFTAYDECNKNEQEFAVVFGYKGKACSCRR